MMIKHVVQISWKCDIAITGQNLMFISKPHTVAFLTPAKSILNIIVLPKQGKCE